MEWLAQYAEFGLVNEQKLALVFVREVGAIDNATYRQLDSSITHARAHLEIHKLCNLGFLEKKGQGRNTYYIRTSKVVSLGERLPSREKVSQLLVDLCAFKPYSYEELALIIQRAAKPMKDKYIKPLRLANKLFYWIPEMINHPLQKYVADPSMARSNTKKKK